MRRLPLAAVPSLLRPGDCLAIAAGAALCAASFSAWRGQPGVAERAVLRQGGQTVAELRLGEALPARRVELAGPLGVTVVELAGRRARVLADPGPRQLCVAQGWLTRPGALALCAPNHVSLQLLGADAAYDSLHY